MKLQIALSLGLIVAAFGPIRAAQSSAKFQFAAILADDTEFRSIADPERATMRGDHEHGKGWTDYSPRQRASVSMHVRRTLPHWPP